MFALPAEEVLKKNIALALWMFALPAVDVFKNCSKDKPPV
jgi:hypothetical protein